MLNIFRIGVVLDTIKYRSNPDKGSEFIPTLWKFNSNNRILLFQLSQYDFYGCHWALLVHRVPFTACFNILGRIRPASLKPLEGTNSAVKMISWRIPPVL